MAVASLTNSLPIMYSTPELERAIAHLQAGNRRLPLDLVRTLQEQGFDPESLVANFAMKDPR